MSKRVLIVGAGLEGALLAGLLGRRGVEVELFETAEDASAAGAGGSALLTARGVVALREAGLAREALEASAPVYGYRVHAVTGQQRLERFGARAEAVYAVERSGLRAMLLARARALPSVRVHEGQRCVGVGTAVPGVVMEPHDGGERRAWEGSMVVGADGPASVVREAMVEAGMGELEQERRGVGSWRFRIGPGEGGAPRMDDRVVHLWPRADAVMVGLPRTDGGFDVVGWQRGASEALGDETSVRRFLQLRFPDVVPMIADLWAQWEASVSGDGWATGVFWRWGDGKLALLGSAACAPFPWPGVGESVGLEDAMWLDRLLGRHEGDVEAALRAFSARREDYAAAVSLSEAMLASTEPGSAAEARRRMLGRLERWMPRLFATPETLVYLRTTPWSEVVELLRRQDRGVGVAVLVAGVFALISLYLVYAWWIHG